MHLLLKQMQKCAKALFLLILLISACNQKQPAVSGQGKDYCAEIARDDSQSVSKLLADHEANLKEKTGVYVLEDGAGSMVTRAGCLWYCHQHDW